MKFFALLTALALLGAGSVAADEPLLWVGCGITKKAFMAELAAAYEKETGVKIELEGGGATKGIRQVSATQADLGGSCRHVIKGAQEEEGVKLSPVAWDALAIIVHPDNPVDDLSIFDLFRLYRGQIDNWSQLGGPNLPLKLFVRQGKISGVGLMIRDLVFEDPDMDFPAEYVFPSSGPLEQAVEQDPAAIAITGISSARKRQVKLLSLEGLQPTVENIASGGYLLYRPLYLVTNKKGERYAEVQSFLDFAYSEQGRKIMKDNGVVPYLEATHLVREQREQRRDIRDLREEADEEG